VRGGTAEECSTTGSACFREFFSSGAGKVAKENDTKRLKRRRQYAGERVLIEGVKDVWPNHYCR
jgi:hypothetical protein